MSAEIRDLLWTTWLKIGAAKCLHLLGYAFLIYVLGFMLSARRSVKIFALSLMMLHGVATEIVQTIVPNRSGRAYDVLIDWVGLCLGMWAGRTIWGAIWTREREKQQNLVPNDNSHTSH